MQRDSELDFEAFVVEQGAALLRLAYLLAGDRIQAQDLLQDVLERVYVRWNTVSGANDPVAYVRRCLANASASRWRRLRARVREVPLHPYMDRPSSDPTTTVDLRDELARVLVRLPPRQRAVLALRYWEDLSEAQTAEMLECSVGTVKAQASRGLARLRYLLEAQGDSQVESQVESQVDEGVARTGAAAGTPRMGIRHG